MAITIFTSMQQKNNENTTILFWLNVFQAQSAHKTSIAIEEDGKKAIGDTSCVFLFDIVKHFCFFFFFV